jgi:Virulence protein
VNNNIVKEIVIFKDDDLVLEVNIAADAETAWLTQNQMSELFNTSSDNIGLHIKNIIQEGELDSLSTTEEFSVVQKEGVQVVDNKALVALTIMLAESNPNEKEILASLIMNLLT